MDHIGVLALFTALTLIFGIVGVTVATHDAQRGNVPLLNGNEFNYFVGGGYHYYGGQRGNNRGSTHASKAGDDDHHVDAGNAVSNNGRLETYAGPHAAIMPAR